MVNASKKAGLGRTLIRAQRVANQRRNPRKSNKHTVDANPTRDNARLDLRSVTAQTNLDQFFEEAELAGKQFLTEKRNLTLIDTKDDAGVDLYSQDEKLEQPDKINQDIYVDMNALSVPRRPKWDSNTTPEQLEQMEKVAFLAWRRKLAKLQENDDVTLTPFEKNIEVWRQFWRVVERSDIVVQILDCRNPLLYLCDDLIKYVNEGPGNKKMNLILLNKADYLTLEQRRMWSKYFRERNLKVIFFSALLENENMKTNNRRDSETENVHLSLGGDESDNSVEELQDNLNEKLQLDDDHIYDKFQLIDLWRDLLFDLNRTNNSETDSDLMNSANTDLQAQEDYMKNSADNETESYPPQNRPPTVGLVGYPNVGKSSTINALLAAKRVAVSATPGKTKHFQTFLIDKNLMLCDCPGLVFPNFVSNKSEMVINGVLPIDQMKDCLGPVRVIVERIPRAFLEVIYGIAFDQDAKQNITADDLLNALGFMRGYMTTRGLPDIARASRKVCKDYINGKILYCEPPPDADKKLYHSHSKLADAMRRIEEQSNYPNTGLKITERQRRLMRQAKGNDIASTEFGAQKFEAIRDSVHIKGLPGIGDMTQPIGEFCEVKVVKREKKHKKREKLRRVYRHLDI